MSEIYVNRAGKKYGPYALDKAETFYSEGRLLPDDWVWTTGWAEWIPAADMFGHLMQDAGTAHWTSGAPETATLPGADAHAPSLGTHAAGVAATPVPPKLHWGWLLVLSIVTFGIFFVVWMFVQSRWIRKIDATSNATFQLAGYLLLAVAGEIFRASSSSGLRIMGLLLVLGSYVLFYVAMYAMRRSMLNRFGSVPGLKLSPALVFLFSIFYLQSRMTHIYRVRMGRT